eukprot:513955_1
MKKEVSNISKISGCIVIHSIRKKQITSQLYDPVSFGLMAICFTCILDIIFLVYINYLIYYASINPTFEDIGYALFIINIPWLVDIIVAIYSTAKYFRYLNISMNMKLISESKIKVSNNICIISMFNMGNYSKCLYNECNINYCNR